LKKKKSGRISKIITCSAITLFSLFIIYPFIYCLSYSLSDSTRVMTENVLLAPIGFTLRNYSKVFSDSTIFHAAFISIQRTVLGSLWAAVLTFLAGYAVSKEDLPGRKFLTIFFIIPMYVSGGLIPYYMLIHDLHLFNNILVYILPGGFYAFNMMLVKSYFDTIPASLEEAAKIDGANYLTIFLRIILPLSKPILAVIIMFTAVSQWNSWFDVVLFITKKDLYPLQTVLQNMLAQSTMSMDAIRSGGGSVVKTISPESVRMATLMVTTIPIVMVYPFFQKHFTKGIMVGAVKA
jgi:putative aldouronate transport system permease protein